LKNGLFKSAPLCLKTLDYFLEDALGLIFGLMFDQMAVGLVLGIAVGAGMGCTLERQAQKKGDKDKWN
ncbi:MAG: hypothetical protein CL608_21425, partial [Anaerolineaceae bacterium]|nr:hypothetical protein [Anaerolineaceae bacterium]